MQSVDQRLLKWWGELMLACSSNIELWKKVISSGTDVQDWYDILEVTPGVPQPPFAVEEINEIHRQWLALFGAVPRRDYNALKERLVAVEEECGKLRYTLNEVMTAMSDLKQLPETMTPWLEFAKTAMKSHMDWLNQLGQKWRAQGKEEPYSKDT
jgi:hypothetical protein